MRFNRLNLLLITALLGATSPCTLLAMDINTDYVVSNQANLGITRVFDDHQNTVIEFVDIGTERPDFFDARGHRIHMARVGDYAVLTGLQSEVHVKEGKAEAVVKVATIQRPSPSSTIKDSLERAAPGRPRLALTRPAGEYAAIPIHDASTVGLSPTRTVPPAITKPQPVVTVTPEWTLKRGTAIGTQLKGWATAAHWTLIWCYPSDYLAPTQYSPPYADFLSAFKNVIETLAANGAPIRYHVFDGNNTLVVFRNDESTCGATTP